jgi:hypothetical protein
MNSLRPNARTQQRNNARSSVRPFAPKPAVLERCARAAAEASGYRFTGKSIITSAETNPRASQFVAIATAVLDEARMKGTS